MLIEYTTRQRLVKYVGSREVKSSVSESLHKIGIGGARVFLSHSHADKELIEIAIALLRKERAEIYIDHKDPEMPETTNTQTANRLREKIKQCDRFVVVASDKATKESRWVPWELGFADGCKYDHIVILPVKESDAR